MTNRNEYLQHLDFSGDKGETVRGKFRDTRSPAKQAADASRAKLAAAIAKNKEHDRTATLRGIFVRGGGL